MLLTPILATGLLGQIAKMLNDSRRKGKWQPGKLGDFESFPSLHPLLGGALSYQVWQETGWNDPVFAIAAAFIVVILYDTSGVKRAAGRQAQMLSFLQGRLEKGISLREYLGQSPLRTWAAALLGIVTSLVLERLLLVLGPAW